MKRAPAWYPTCQKCSHSIAQHVALFANWVSLTMLNWIRDSYLHTSNPCHGHGTRLWCLLHVLGIVDNCRNNTFLVLSSPSTPLPLLSSLTIEKPYSSFGGQKCWSQQFTIVGVGQRFSHLLAEKMLSPTRNFPQFCFSKVWGLLCTQNLWPTCSLVQNSYVTKVWPTC